MLLIVLGFFQCFRLFLVAVIVLDVGVILSCFLLLEEDSNCFLLLLVFSVAFNFFGFVWKCF